MTVGVVYIGSFPFSIRSYRRLKRTAEEIRAAPLRVVSAAAQPPAG